MYEDIYHVPVLLNETIDLLINENLDRQIIVDGTLGGGGYSELICKRFNELNSKDNLLICFDKDEHAISFASNRLKIYSEKIIIEKGNFADMRLALKKHNIPSVTGIVLDLGLSSYQLENEDGFSFMRNTTLDMRADKEKTLTAKDILNSYSAEELSVIFEQFGEIGNPDRLSESIALYRKISPFKTTEDLTHLIDAKYKIDKKNKMNFLAKIFQALRIEVNGELEDLKSILSDSKDLLQRGGRIAVITYHSLEDRIVKLYFKEKSFKEKKSKYSIDKNDLINPEFKLVNKKVITPSYKEISENPRSRSAKLRVAEKL
ncbi:MAG TPA: 16S rRNA (cytosine(1402)-N(4))-methyltransferase RsmH [Ignavibacteria bacterium]|nr:16S rRNA (cytosine(1402)-N(4))-methyltransferase RsmH [Ignavibacteria bacterium]